MLTLAIAFPAFDPVLIEIGPLAIRWYALAWIFGLIFGWQLMRRLVQRPGWRITPTEVDDLLLYVTIGVVLGGRLGYVLVYRPDFYLANPLEALAVWEGGMSFHGGMLGVVAALALFAKLRGLPLLQLADAAAVVTPIGLFLGRIANFINGELYGRVTDVPWGVIFPRGGPDPRHPSQLYQAGLEGLLLFAILLYLAWRPYRPETAGRLTGVFLVGYGVARIIGELFREPDAHLGFLIGGLTMGQLLSLPMLALGLVLIAVSYAGERRSFERS